MAKNGVPSAVPRPLFQHSVGNYAPFPPATSGGGGGAPIALPARWGFFGDSQTGGRSPYPSTVSHHVAFRNIWAASGFTAPTQVVQNGQSGRSLANTALAISGQSFASAPWLHVQESGDQNSAGQRTPTEFGATFEAMWRSNYARFPQGIFTYETAHSFNRIGERYRDWETTADWSFWGYASQGAAISYNAEMRRRIAILAADGIVVRPVFTAEYINALIAVIPGGYATIEADANPYHYDGVGNFMIALAKFHALNYDVNELNFSTVTINADSTTDASWKQMCVSVINNTVIA